MGLNTLVVILLLLLAIWWLMRKRRTALDDYAQPRSRPRKKTTPYHAVSIRFTNNACNAAKEMAGRRFLATAAPKLPLPGCDVFECNCRFVHHDDRRSGTDRRSPFSPAHGFGGSGSHEQRTGRDRRRGTTE